MLDLVQGNTFPLRRRLDWLVDAAQYDPLYRSRHGTADETVQPVVVRPQRFEAPFAYVAAVAVGEDRSLRSGDVF